MQIAPHSHKPIISAKDFQAAQELLLAQSNIKAEDPAPLGYRLWIGKIINKDELPLTLGFRKSGYLWVQSNKAAGKVFTARPAIISEYALILLRLCLPLSFTAADIQSIEDAVSIRLRALEGDLRALAQIKASRERFYAHHTKTTYETLLRQHRLSQLPSTGHTQIPPLPNVEEERRKIHAEIRQIQAQRDFAISEMRSSNFPGLLTPLFYEKSILEPYDPDMYIGQRCLHVYLHLSFSVLELPKAEAPFLPSDAPLPGVYYCQIRNVICYCFHLIPPQEPAPGILDYITALILQGKFPVDETYKEAP